MALKSMEHREKPQDFPVLRAARYLKEFLVSKLQINSRQEVGKRERTGG